MPSRRNTDARQHPWVVSSFEAALEFSLTATAVHMLAYGLGAQSDLPYHIASLFDIISVAGFISGCVLLTYLYEE